MCGAGSCSCASPLDVVGCQLSSKGCSMWQSYGLVVYPPACARVVQGLFDWVEGRQLVMLFICLVCVGMCCCHAAMAVCKSAWGGRVWAGWQGRVSRGCIEACALCRRHNRKTQLQSQFDISSRTVLDGSSPVAVQGVGTAGKHILLWGCVGASQGSAREPV